MADKLPVLLFKTRMQFTTRPELTGTFGMVSTTHWLASAAGLSMLEKGGTAADAAFRAGRQGEGGLVQCQRKTRAVAQRGLDESQLPERREDRLAAPTIA